MKDDLISSTVRAPISRRNLLKAAGSAALIHQFGAFSGIYDLMSVRDAKAASNQVDLVVDNYGLDIDGRIGKAVSVGGSVPGQLVRLKEGEEAELRVINRLDEPTSIHWHGIILPYEMDGVPGVTYPGVAPGESFTHRFTVKQSGTYWYHSHSGFQEQRGMFGPLIIDPIKPEPFEYERDFAIMLHDWSFESPKQIITKLLKEPDYYNFQRRTLREFIDDARKDGLGATIKERSEWARMNMDPTDLADVTSHTYTYLMNGHSPKRAWRALFEMGERIRLRFINAAAMTIYDVRIPGLKMTVVQADGQNVKPVAIDEFRFGPGETYDVIVEPDIEKAYAIVGETLDRSGQAIGMLATSESQEAEVPPKRPRPVRTMMDMGMPMKMSSDGTMGGMDMGDDSSMQEHGSHKMDMGLNTDSIPGRTPVKSPPNNYGVNNAATPAFTWSRLDEPGVGLDNVGHKVLVYTDLEKIDMQPDMRPPAREIELHLTGNMERYLWGINGKTLSEAPEPIRLELGERFRLTIVNYTMMEHPMHLHGFFMELENGRGMNLPNKHTVLVKPSERVSLLVTPDALGLWSFHCHLLLHMDMGMFRVFEVVEGGKGK